MASTVCSVRSLHGVFLILLFAAGLVLLYVSADWYVQNQPGNGTAALGVVSCCCLSLALLGQRQRAEGIIAATVVSAFWSVGTSVAFARGGYSFEASLLLVSSLIQVTCALLGGALSADKQTEHNLINPPMISGGQGGVARNYGALSSFVDPLYIPTGTRPKSESQASSQGASPAQSPFVAQRTPHTSPQLVPRSASPFGTPSPFGNSSPHKPPLTSLSAAAQDPKEVGEAYRALWDKHDL